MITKKISVVIKWAANARPPGYIDILKKMSETWDVEKDEYTITEENWNALAREYSRSKPNPINSKDRCSYRTCGGCAGGPQCKPTGNNCLYGPGTFDQCMIWQEINK